MTSGNSGTWSGGATDVVIVGAGIIGLASAHALLRGGASVRLVDRSLPGAGDSTKTGGGIRLAHGTEANVVLTQLSLPFWTGFPAVTGVDPGYRQTGHLFLTSAAKTDSQFRSQAEWVATLGVRSEVLSRNEIGRRWPHLSQIAFETGSYCDIGGYLDHHRVIHGYVRAVEAEGGIIVAGVPVDELLIDDGRVLGVGTPSGRFYASHVVNAAGASAGLIAALAGLQIPFVSRRHELL
ncbi:MAG: FAD-binding oxidoreductase, partial [Acidimicrobiia bacterium]|nr:FAD-binding oxidoreductase [Acidimicrobiia bacterium]